MELIASLLVQGVQMSLVLAAAPDWGSVWPRLGALTALAVVMSWLATKAFAAYQRSL